MDEKDTVSLLGNAAAKWPEAPSQSTLETFPNRSPEQSYWVLLDFPEFCSLCPVTGQPDTARIRIQYLPSENCVETKSLKFYLSSYRNHPSFNEEIVNRILQDLSGVLNPKRMTVRGDFSSRGGISLTAQATFPASAENPPLEAGSGYH